MAAERRRVAYLHVGIEKTGTTTIQSFMANNRDALSARGVGYPRTPGWANHLKLNAYAMHPEKIDDTRERFEIRSPDDVSAFRQQFRDELYNEIQADLADCHKIVLSNEHCSARLTTHQEVAELLNLVSSLCGHITVVVYLREQGSNMVSSYSTNLRNGASRLPDFDSINWAKYDYYERITRWSDHVGRENVRLRVLDDRRLVDGDLISDFMDAIDEPLADGLVRPGIRNEGLDASALRILRLFNEAVEEREGLGDSRERRERLIAALQARPRGPRLAFPTDKIRWLRDACEPSNRRLAREFLDRDDLFPPAEEDVDAVDHREPTVRELMDALISVLEAD